MSMEVVPLHNKLTPVQNGDHGLSEAFEVHGG
jgi:hypothetical protein